MKIRCSQCGKKVRDDADVCPECGAVLYEGVFGDISAEIDRELGEVTQEDIDRVRAEMGDSKAKMTFGEFREFFIRESGIKPPILPKARGAYEHMLTVQYSNYLRNPGK